MQAPVVDLGDSVVSQYLLGGQLVHGQCRAEHAASHVGHVSYLQQPLNGAVLPEGSVEQRENSHRPLKG